MMSGLRAPLRAHPWLRHVLLAAVWILLWRMSALMAVTPHASVWFPPAGLSFAALILMGWSAVPVLLACAVAVTFLAAPWADIGRHWTPLLESGVLFGLTHCLSYGIGAWILRHVARRSTAESLPSLIMAFLFSGCLAALGAAVLGTRVLVLAGIADPALMREWRPWWIGDMAGALVLTPLFLGLLGADFPQLRSRLQSLGLHTPSPPHGRNAYALKLLVCVSLLSVVMLMSAHVRMAETSYSVFFLILPQMWIVYTESPFRSVLSLALFSTVMAVWVATLGLIDQAPLFQYAICVIAASAYFGLAVPVLLARNKQLSELAFQDSLTKAASRQHFFDRGSQVLSEARRFELPVALVVFDIDHFKDVNDRFGHAIGDQALMSLAVTVRMQLRHSDVFGRFGGDEFMLLLPGIDQHQAVATAERLRQLLQQAVIPGTDQALTASFGVVVIEADETIMQAFKRADRLLLDVKRSGRNRIGPPVDADQAAVSSSS